jgi:hypothetical protein
VMRSAPTTGPQTVPTPPQMQIRTGWMELSMPKIPSGSMKPT